MNHLMRSIFGVSFLIMICCFADAETIPARYLPNPKVSEAYYVEGDETVAIEADWAEACKKVGLGLTDVPGGKFCVNRLGNPTYPQPGDVCADGSFRVPGWGKHCDDSYATCPDSSWTLSADQKTCSRDNHPLECTATPETVSEETLLAAIVYGEASTKNSFEEMAAIASAVVRIRDAHGSRSLQAFIKQYPRYSKVILNGNVRFKEIMCSNTETGHSYAYLAARNALTGGKDYSFGACFWDGLDLKNEGSDHYRYLYGFKFTDPSHNIFHIVEPPARPHKMPRATYDHVYDSTAAYGNTIFWKYNADFMKARGVKQCH